MINREKLYKSLSIEPGTECIYTYVCGGGMYGKREKGRKTFLLRRFIIRY